MYPEWSYGLMISHIFMPGNRKVLCVIDSENIHDGMRVEIERSIDSIGRGLGVIELARIDLRGRG